MRPIARAASPGTTSSSRSAGDFGVISPRRSLSAVAGRTGHVSSCRCSCCTTTRSGPRTCRLQGPSPGRAKAASSAATSSCSIRSRSRRGRVVPGARRRDRSAARRAARPGAHGPGQSLAAPLRPRAAAAHSPLFDLVRHDGHRRLGAPLSRARRRLRSPAPAHDAVATRRALRRSVARVSARLAARARTRVLPARNPAGHERRRAAVHAAAGSVRMRYDLGS